MICGSKIKALRDSVLAAQVLANETWSAFQELHNDPNETGICYADTYFHYILANEMYEEALDDLYPLDSSELYASDPYQKTKDALGIFKVAANKSNRARTIAKMEGQSAELARAKFAAQIICAEEAQNEAQSPQTSWSPELLRTAKKEVARTEAESAERAKNRAVELEAAARVAVDFAADFAREKTAAWEAYKAAFSALKDPVLFRHQYDAAALINSDFGLLNPIIA